MRLRPPFGNARKLRTKEEVMQNLLSATEASWRGLRRLVVAVAAMAALTTQAHAQLTLNFWDMIWGPQNS